MDINDKSCADLQEVMRAELEATRATFHKLLLVIPEDDWHKPSSNPAWTVGELLYHMSMALRMLPEDVRLIRWLGWTPRPPASLFNWLNECFTRRGARNLTLESIAEKYDSAHADVLNLLGTIRDDEWDKGMDYPDWDPLLSGHVTIERLFHYPALHFESHAAHIQSSSED